MADNYLENRMEELRSGKLTSPVNKHTHTPAINKIQFNFPPKRILILEGLSEEGLSIGESYRISGSRVAYISSSPAASETPFYKKASDKGYIVCIADSAEKFERELNDVLSQWRGIDLIINFNSSLADRSQSIIADYLSNRPSPSSYVSRVISICSAGNQFLRKHPNETFPIHYLISYRHSYGSVDQLKRMVQFLSLPEASQISNDSFNI